MEGLYCENDGAAYGIKASGLGTGGRLGNHIIGLHMDGPAVVSTLYDPWGEITVQASGFDLPPGHAGEANAPKNALGWRLSQVELYSILGAGGNRAGTVSNGPLHHMSFWRPVARAQP